MKVLAWPSNVGMFGISGGFFDHTCCGVDASWLCEFMPGDALTWRCRQPINFLSSCRTSRPRGRRAHCAGAAPAWHLGEHPCWATSS